MRDTESARSRCRACGSSGSATGDSGTSCARPGPGTPRRVWWRESEPDKPLRGAHVGRLLGVDGSPARLLRTAAGASAKIRPVGRRELVTCAVASAWIAVALCVDAAVGLSGQLVLGAITAAVLLGLLALHPPTIRYQALAVVAIATVGEVIGSIVWGLYTYRLENLPAFVPPGHGLVYLAGMSLAARARERGRALVVGAGLLAGAWGIAGITVLPRPDASGALGCAFLVAVLVWTRRPVYAGVFLVVAALELYGTAIGTWTWAWSIPGLGLSQGNPPSGVASGYVLFDVLALAVVAQVGAVATRRRQSRRARSTAASTTVPLRISSRAESTLPQTSQSRSPRAIPAPST